MQIDFDVTSEQLIKMALARYKTQHESPDVLLSNVIADIHSNTDSATVIRQAVTNSIAEGLRRMERQAMAAEHEFQSIGQMTLFGEPIPGHNIPTGLSTRPAAEVRAWMENRAEIERENAGELLAAAKKQEDKASRFSAWASATRKICEALTRAGLDPNEVSYAEAINKAEAVHRRRGADAGAPTTRAMR